jgi:hypothetical protein
MVFGVDAILLITKATFHSLKNAFTLNGVQSVCIKAKSASFVSKKFLTASLSSLKSSSNICLAFTLSSGTPHETFHNSQ